MNRPLKVNSQPAFVLHSYPYKESSLIVDVLTRDYGRLALLAKGAKRPQSQLRGVLQTFQALSISWTGKSELQTLTAAEWVGGMPPLEKNALFCGFYLNELILKLTHRDDPQAQLFDAYCNTINLLAHTEPAPIVIRKFEWNLLRLSGVLNDLSYCAPTGSSVISNQLYVVEPESGTRPAVNGEPGIKVLGKTLIDIEAQDYSDPTTQSQSKHLMRSLLAYHLQGAPIHTRQILIDLQKI